MDDRYRRSHPTKPSALVARDPSRLNAIRFVAEVAAYSEPDVPDNGMASRATLDCPQENAGTPKSNRMPEAPHSVKVEAEVVNAVQGLRNQLIRHV